MFDATVETTTTYRLTVKQIEDIILKAAGVERGSDVKITFSVHESSGGGHGYEPYQAAGLDGATLTITKKERNTSTTNSTGPR